MTSVVYPAVAFKRESLAQDRAGVVRLESRERGPPGADKLDEDPRAASEFGYPPADRTAKRTTEKYGRGDRPERAIACAHPSSPDVESSTLDARRLGLEPPYQSRGEARVGRLRNRFGFPSVPEQPTIINDRGRRQHVGEVRAQGRHKPGRQRQRRLALGPATTGSVARREIATHDSGHWQSHHERR